MVTETCSQTGINLEEIDFGYTLSLISGKYKMIVMYWLNENKPVMRYNELKRRIGTISFKTLSNTLKELEQDGIINRVEYPQIPPKVEYSLSKRGESLMPILDLMCDWGGKNRN
ncbi:TPA: winged helix-turn-helix transcriptional regulator [Salmonella enterica]|uniref:winged helix-turn-helix transcriptional regulator n=1 Tax=Salmonella enterica TaxID=28901 RepID=UPI000F949470|nr:transcriptional regulator [Salmonella enterica]EBS2082069.1 transcriptional regulator [Salmonella enterica subsp. enterica serovar Muenster]EAR8956006.1 transcriptional regulator [Salmonella enterica]EAT4679810.1 transcriptional regulator [Salmonella enterica]EBH2232575.1 helix-turn-helix transcriptional regulator [Salmonella enterica]